MSAAENLVEVETPAPPAALPGAMAPHVVGRYRIDEAIAHGGMASVHLGRLMGPVGFARSVAVKRMHPHLRHEHDFVSMFVDEARIASRIRHPNVVSVLDVVEDEDELLLVMEYVHGESLATLTRAARARGVLVPLRIASAILTGVLHGLEAAHEATDDHGAKLNVVHRDVTPQNVLVGVDGIARLVDFGVASAEGCLHQTNGAQAKGKVAYMAPEQLGDGEPTRAVDLYAASVVLWELVAGRRMLPNGSASATMKAILALSPDAPSTRRSDAQGSQEDSAAAALLDAVVLRGLAREPRDRFASADEMAQALDRAVPPGTQAEVAAWVTAFATPELARRSERLAQLETATAGDRLVTSSGIARLTDRATPRDAKRLSGPSLVEAPVTRREGALGAVALAGLVSPLDAHARKRTRARRAIVGVVTLAVTAACVMAAMARSQADAAPPPPVTAALPVASGAAPALAPSANTPTGSAPAVDAVTPSAAPRATSAPRPARTRVPAAGPAPVDDCDPPFVLDEAGRRVYKRRCLR